MNDEPHLKLSMSPESDVPKLLANLGALRSGIYAVVFGSPDYLNTTEPISRK